jgi:UDP-N-acetylmuramoyl-tripeptide--D-alanyl-D-alanine ligase
MRRWDAGRVARSASALFAGGKPRQGTEPGPSGVSIDSRALTPGELFVGLPGTRADGGEHASEALARGAWGVLVGPEHAERAIAAATAGVVLTHPDPLRSLQDLAVAWRDELAAGGARFVAITGSTGKTSTKDILAALLARSRRVASSPQNLNTEIGLPLALLAARSDTEVVVLEMAMRGAGQIAELGRIARPDVGVITNVGPVHLELLGSLQAIAAAKAELIAELPAGATLAIPAAEPLLQPHLRTDVHTVTFGTGGDVTLTRTDSAPDGRRELAIRIAPRGSEPEQLVMVRASFAQAHNVLNLLAAVAAASALGPVDGGDLDVSFSSLRGERIELPSGVTLINDCYNANPMSMRAALDDLAETAAARRVAVLGDMLELGGQERELHRALGDYAGEAGVEVLLTVGSLAAEMAATFPGEVHAAEDAEAAAQTLSALLRAGDTVLVKGSRGVRLERVAELLAGERATAAQGSFSAARAAGGER